MKTVAIIAEYNPFHNGHLYQINKAKSELNADYCVAIISGNFLQRGTPAMWDKYTRAKMCISNGIDLALELPAVYATGSAMDFAMGAVSILDRLNSIDYLCFGAETDDISLLNEISTVIASETDEYKSILKNALAEGKSYPAAREHALAIYLKNKNLIEIISKPNNILAIEYLVALKKLNSKIKPYIIKREAAMYHDRDLKNGISSATSIRQHINSNTDFESLKSEVPDSVYDIITKTNNISAPVTENDMSVYIQHSLITEKDFSRYYGINESLNNRIKNSDLLNDYENLIEAITTKNTTKTTVSRGLIHMLLNYTNDNHSEFIENGYAYYANILGFKKESSILIKTIKESSTIPVITKRADFETELNIYENTNKIIANKMHSIDLQATNLYNLIVYNKYNTKNKNDYTTPIVII